MTGTSIEAIEKLSRSTALDKSSIVGATVVTTRAVRDENQMDLDVYLVIDVYSSDCEVRKVTGVDDRNYTLESALSNAHVAGAPVLVLESLDLNVKYFGAVGDGVTDDSTAIQAALDAAEGGILRCPPHTFAVETKLVLPQPIHLLCSPSTWFKATASMTTVFEMDTLNYNVQAVNIQNLKIDANDLATNGIVLFKLSLYRYTAVDGIYVKDAVSAGIVLQACQGGTFKSMQVESSGRGIDILGCNSARFIGISAYGNTGDGITVGTYDSDTFKGPCTIYGAHSENNGGNGIVVSATVLVSILGGYIEGSGEDGIQLNGINGVVKYMAISGDAAYRAVRIGADADGAVVKYNALQPTTFGEVVTTAGAGGLIEIGPNFNRTTGAVIDINDSVIHGSLGVGGITPEYDLHVLGTWILGQNTEADDTNKTMRLAGRHYDNEEQPLAIIRGTSTGSAGTVSIGGGSSLSNAATALQFYTAPNNITVTGSLRLYISKDGDVVIGNSTTPNAKLEVIGLVDNQQLIVKGFSSQTANIVEIKDSGDNVLFAIQGDGDIDLSNTAVDIVIDTTTGTKIGTAADQKIGFFGATPVVQQTEITDELTTITHSAPGTPDYAIADPIQPAGFGFTTQDEALTVLSVIANLQARVNELETRLVTLGFVADAD